jgi:preprotein translocase subunit SecF
MRRLKLVPEKTNIDFFKIARVTFGGSVVLTIASIVLFFVMGLNYGIDFEGGTTIRVQSQQAINVGKFRQALQPLKLGDVMITQVFDPNFGAEKHVAMVRVQAQNGQQSITPDTTHAIEAALKKVDNTVTFPSIESVGPKVSKELIKTAILSVVVAVAAIIFYIWLRFEWQFAMGAVAATVHDVALTVGIFVVFQLKFDLSIVAAILTIIG